MDVIKYILNKPTRRMKKAGVVMSLMANKPNGLPIPQLSPRTLPNGIANSPTVQRVSGDYVIQASDMSIVTSATNVDQVSIGIAKLVGIIDSGVVDGVATKVASTNSVPLNGASADNVASIGKHYLTTTSFRIIVAKGTTLAEAQALLTGTVIRYQLATPIDTLNVPFTNPLIDLANSVGKNLFDGAKGVNKTVSAGVLTDNTARFANINIKVNPNTTYTVKSFESTLNVRTVWGHDANGNILSALVSDTNIAETSFTTGSNVYGVTVVFCSLNLTDIIPITTGVNAKLQLELGNTATAYEPYKKNNALLQNFAATQTDGYTLEATVNSNGQAVGYENLVVNGDFANGLTNWTNVSVGTPTISSGILNFTATAQGGRIIQSVNFDASKRYYVALMLKADSNLVSLRDYTGGTTIKAHSGGNTFEKLSGILTPGSGGSRFIGAFDNRTSAWTQVQMDEMQIINLTDNPLIQALETALGRQLTVAECDRIFPFVATTGTTLVSARPYVATEGLDSLGVLANNPSVDIVGTEDFAISWCGITPTTLQASTIIAKNLDGLVNNQYLLYLQSDGVLSIYLNSSGFGLTVTGYIKSNSQTKIDVERKDGRLKCWVNDVLTYDQANTTSLTTQPNFRLFARSSNASGTTHTAYAKLLTAYLILARGTYGDLDKLDGVLDKVARDYR